MKVHAHWKYDPDKRDWVPDTCLSCRLRITKNRTDRFQPFGKPIVVSSPKD